MALRVFVTRRLPPDMVRRAVERAANEGASLVFDEPDSDAPPSREELLAKIRGAAGLICTLSEQVDVPLLAAAGPSLKIVSTISVGTSHIDVSACAAAGIRVGYTPGVLTDATADLVLALTLATARRIPEGVAAVRSGAWTAWNPFWLVGKDVWGATVGIVGGSGRIGAAVARRFHGGFDCSILYTNRSGAVPEFDRVYAAEWAPLDELIARSDIVVVLCALTPETRGLLDARRLALLKPDALLINAARGEVVDQAALVELLRARPAMAAGLDVTSPEPLPLDSPLLALPNCVVLPHIGSAGAGARTAMVRIALENATAALTGAPMPSELL